MLTAGDGFSLPAIYSFLRTTPGSPFPVSDEKVLHRISMFNNTATFGNYISPQEKCCCFLRSPTAWLTSCVRHVANGLKKCLDRIFRFSNCIRSKLLTRLVEFESPNSEFAQSAYMSFLFAFRVPSETIWLIRAYSDDALYTFSPHQGRPFRRYASSPGNISFFAKLSRRGSLKRAASFVAPVSVRYRIGVDLCPARCAPCGLLSAVVWRPGRSCFRR